MMMSVSSIVGLPYIPSTKRGIHDWLKRNCIPLAEEGNRFTFNLSDLPEDVRRAFIERQCEAKGLPAGTYDDDEHARLMAAPAGMRAAAERAAAIARYMVPRRGVVAWTYLVAQVRAEFGAKGCSEATLRRILDDVTGVDPINFAPALLANHKGKTARADLTYWAWSFFMTTIRDAGEEFPLKQAWRDVRDVAPATGWQWPSYPTVFRHWQSLPPAQRLHARLGHAEAVKSYA